MSPQTMPSETEVRASRAEDAQALEEDARLRNDIRLLVSGPRSGFGELRIPAVQPGSSIMPGKVNPAIPEMVNQVCFQVMGCDATIALACEAGQLELNVMMPIMASTLLDATQVAANAVRTLREKCIEGLQPNEERMTLRAVPLDAPERIEVPGGGKSVVVFRPDTPVDWSCPLASACPVTGFLPLA